MKLSKGSVNQKVNADSFGPEFLILPSVKIGFDCGNKINAIKFGGWLIL
ncbi:hypothetical protein [Acinetobacter baumannii]|nr:hypothetical protein [Acinetobacter baumannii]